MSGSTASLIVLIPVIRMAKPASIVPTSFFVLLFANNIIPTPIIARTGENDVGFNRLMIRLSP